MTDELFQFGGFLCRLNVRYPRRKETGEMGQEELSFIQHFLECPLRAECLARFSWGYRVGYNMVFPRDGKLSFMHHYKC